MHTSVKMNTPCELINVTPLNPMISKCQIKVCYVGDEPNRNGSIITKETATKMANSLPGSPIVGFWKDEEKDFDEHNQVIHVGGGSFEISDETRPYGFVDLGAKVWFQDYMDNDKIHTYMVTEGYIWTGRYPETNRILSRGNNQSMELDEQSLKGNWTIDDKSGMEFFIINDAIFKGLCILGENVEPCFEGAQITSTFSLDESFDSKIYKLMKEVQELKGGNLKVEYVRNPEQEVTDPILDDEQKPEAEVPAAEPEVKDHQEEEPETVSEENNDNAAGAEAGAEDPEAEGQEGEQPAENEEEPSENNENEENNENLENQGDDVQFSLIDFQNLQESYANLQTQFNDLNDRFNAMKESYDALVEFKNAKDREDKQAIIDKFYMLSDEDKKDVVENMDSYSLDEIEAKLCVICVHNKLDMSDKADNETNPGTTFNLDNVDDDSEDDNIPALVSILRKNRKKEN